MMQPYIGDQLDCCEHYLRNFEGKIEPLSSVHDDDFEINLRVSRLQLNVTEEEVLPGVFIPSS